MQAVRTADAPANLTSSTTVRAVLTTESLTDLSNYSNVPDIARIDAGRRRAFPTQE